MVRGYDRMLLSQITRNMRYTVFALICLYYVFIWLSYDLLMKKVGIGFGSKRRLNPSEASERHRTLELRHSKYVTQRALRNVVEAIKADGPLHHSSRAAQYRARKSIARTETPYGQLVIERTRDEVTYGVSPPLAAMWYHTKHSKSYSEVILDSLRRAPNSASSPWNVVFYQDGVDPSDGLAKSHTRKSAVYYWTVKEFGYDVLGQEQVWLTSALIRATQLADLNGEHATVAKDVLETMFNEKIDAEHHGVTLELHEGGSVHIFLKLGVLLADEPALKELISCKGHAGLKCCTICANAVLENNPKGAECLAKHDGWLKSIAERRLSALCQ